MSSAQSFVMITVVEAAYKCTITSSKPVGIIRVLRLWYIQFVIHLGQPSRLWLVEETILDSVRSLLRCA